MHLNELSSGINNFLKLEVDSVLVTVFKTTGSTPRDRGTLMLVNSSSFVGTIGGGRLEYDAIENARSFINDFNFTTSRLQYSLGPVLGQCCGGKVELSFRKVTPEVKKWLLEQEELNNNLLGSILIFGGGHVGQALVEQLKTIPFNVTIVDSRPRGALNFQLPHGCKTTPFPEAEVRNAKPNSAFVILTHDHSLDFILVKEALIKNDAAYIGMIGSETKKSVLKNWLVKEGVTGFEKIFTPLGASLANMDGFNKEPSVIASLIITEILLVFHAKRSFMPDKIDSVGLAL